MSEEVVACSLSAGELAARGERWHRLVERDCCAFAAWEVSRDGDTLLLDVTAEGEAVPAVQAMFGSLRTR
jgi:hypothetical protein